LKTEKRKMVAGEYYNAHDARPLRETAGTGIAALPTLKSVLVEQI